MRELYSLLRQILHELRRFNDSLPYIRQQISHVEAMQELKKEQKRQRESDRENLKTTKLLLREQNAPL